MPIKIDQAVHSNLPINQYLIDLYENPATDYEYKSLVSKQFIYNQFKQKYAHGLIQDVLILVVLRLSENSDQVRLHLMHQRLSVKMINDILAIAPTALLIVNPNLSARQIFMLNALSKYHRPEDMITLLKRTDILPELRTANIILNDDTISKELIDLKQSTPLISNIVDDNFVLSNITIPVAIWSKLINLPTDTRTIMSTPAQHQTS